MDKKPTVSSPMVKGEVRIRGVGLGGGMVKEEGPKHPKTEGGTTTAKAETHQGEVLTFKCQGNFTNLVKFAAYFFTNSTMVARDTWPQ